MVCPFAAPNSQLGSTVTTLCPFASTVHGIQQVQHCSAAGASRSANLTGNSRTPTTCNSTKTISPSSSSDSLTEHQTVEIFDAIDTALLGPVSNSSNRNSSSADKDAAGTIVSSSSSPTITTSSSSSNSSITHQSWQLKRPVLQHDPKLTRRQLRQLGRSWTLADVAQHRYCDDGWIAVDGKVYDITEHLVNHPGWDSGCQVTTVLSILAHLGIDCSEEFREIHRPYPVAWKQLQAYYIGELQN